MIRPVLNVAKTAKYLSSPKRAGQYTAETATQRKENSKVLD